MSLTIDLTLGDGARSFEKTWDSTILKKVKFTLENKIKNLFNELPSFHNSEILPFTANNLFIHGERGTGKTTVLLSFKEWLKTYSHNDSIKPIVVNELIDASGNTNSLTFYFLSWLKSELDKDKNISIEIQEQLYKVMNKFPSYLKNCDLFCEKIDSEIEEALDYNDLTFRNEFFKLITMYLEYKECGQIINNNSSTPIIFFIDDIDLIFPKERLWKLLTEIYVFLSHPNIIIVAAGDIESLKLQLKLIYSEIKNNINNLFNNTDYIEENIEKIANSLIEKTFSIRNIVRLYNIRYSELENTKIKVSYEEEISFEDFMKGNYKSAKDGDNNKNKYFLLNKKLLLINSPYIKSLLDDIPLRTLVQILKAIHEKQTINSENKQDLNIIDYCISDIFYDALKDKSKLNLDYSTRLKSITYENNGEDNISLIKSSKDEFHIFVKNLRNILNYAQENYKDNDKSDILNYNTLIFFLKKQLKRDYYILYLWMLENIIYLKGIYTFTYFIAFLEILFHIHQKEKSLSGKDFIDLIEQLYLNNSDLFVIERIIYENIYKKENIDEKSFLIFPLNPAKRLIELSQSLILFSSYIKEPQHRYYHSWMKLFSTLYLVGDLKEIEKNEEKKKYLKNKISSNYLIEIFSISEEETEEIEEGSGNQEDSSTEERADESLIDKIAELVGKNLLKSEGNIADINTIIDKIDIDIIYRIHEKVDRTFSYINKLYKKLNSGYILNEFLYLNTVEAIISSKPTSTAGNIIKKLDEFDKLIFLLSSYKRDRDRDKKEDLKKKFINKFKKFPLFPKEYINSLINYIKEEIIDKDEKLTKKEKEELKKKIEKLKALNKIIAKYIKEEDFDNIEKFLKYLKDLFFSILNYENVYKDSEFLKELTKKSDLLLQVHGLFLPKIISKEIIEENEFENIKKELKIRYKTKPVREALKSFLNSLPNLESETENEPEGQNES